MPPICADAPTAAQRRRLVDLLRQVQARRLTLRPARRLTLCYRKERNDCD